MKTLTYYSFWDGEGSNYFATKSGAIKEAREHAKWYLDKYPDSPKLDIEVKRETIDASKKGILNILQQRGYIIESEIALTINMQGKRND